MRTGIRTYGELIQLETFRERFDYLAIRNSVGCETFGFDRWINQRFYTSPQWRSLRRNAIARDFGRDLAFPDREIHDKIIVHHMNPLTVDDIVEGSEFALNLDYLICCTHLTHNAIHYGDYDLIPKPYTPREPGDTKLW